MARAATYWAYIHVLPECSLSGKLAVRGGGVVVVGDSPGSHRRDICLRVLLNSLRGPPMETLPSVTTSLYLSLPVNTDAQRKSVKGYQSPHWGQR